MTSIRVGVVGASGFIGTAVVEALQRRGHEVVRVRAPRISPDTSPEEVTASSEIVRTLAESFKGVSVVINAAGVSDATAVSELDLRAANAILPGYIGLAAKTARVSRYIHVSSAAVQGDADTLTEHTSVNPFSPYSRAKSLGEEMALLHGPRETVLYRPGGVHAPQRRVTQRLAKFAVSPFASFAGDGSANTPQALLGNVADALAFVATIQKHPPEVIAHPSEHLTVQSLMHLLGASKPLRVPEPLGRLIISLMSFAESALPGLAAHRRRLQVLWFGQAQATSWVSRAGWTPPEGEDGWRSMAAACGGKQSSAGSPVVLYGVTTGLAVKSFFESQFAYLQQAGWGIVLVAPDDGVASEFARREGVKYAEIAATRQPSLLRDIATLLELIRILRRVGPEIAVWGTPKIGLLGTLASRIMRTSSIYVVHGLRFESERGWRRGYLLALERLACTLADRVVAVGYDLKSEMCRARIARPDKVDVLGYGSANGVTAGIPRHGARARLDLPSDAIVISFVGRITKDKGVIELLDAWRTVAQSQDSAFLLLAGDHEDSELQSLISTTIKTGVRIKDLGFVEDLTDLYSASDCLVLPSYREGLPTVVLEAAAYGVPSIVTDVTGAREPVIHGETGWIIPPRDVIALQRALEEVFADRSECAVRGGRAKKLVMGRYARDRVHANWEAYLRRIRLGVLDSALLDRSQTCPGAQP